MQHIFRISIFCTYITFIFIVYDCTIFTDFLLYFHALSTVKKVTLEKDGKEDTKEKDKEKEKVRGEGRERGREKEKEREKDVNHFESKKYLNLPDRERILGQLAGTMRTYVLSIHTYAH